jgi:hypothetical protein
LAFGYQQSTQNSADDVKVMARYLDQGLQESTLGSNSQSRENAVALVQLMIAMVREQGTSRTSTKIALVSIPTKASSSLKRIYGRTQKVVAGSGHGARLRVGSVTYGKQAA